MAFGRAGLAAVTAAKPTTTRLDRQQRLLAVGLVLGVTMVGDQIVVDGPDFELPEVVVAKRFNVVRQKTEYKTEAPYNFSMTQAYFFFN